MAVLVVASKAPSASGRVVDPEGRPIAGAEVCAVLAGGAPGLCGRSREDGSYDLPANATGEVRIVVRGYLPRTIAAVAQGQPIVLERAAALRIRIVDRVTGKPAETAQVEIVYADGRKLGAFPANASGLSLPTLPVGAARVVVRGPGFKEARSEVVQLQGGRATEVVVSIDSGKADAHLASPGK